jgi:hypothetical protein
MKYLILIAVFTILILACDKKEDLNKKNLSIKPEIPENDSLDLNSDQIIDFVISYREFATYDEPSSGGSIIGSISPLNQNKLLYSNSGGYIFLGINDTIRKVSNSNSDWMGYDADLIKIDKDYQNWDRTWTVIYEQLFYNFLAYKIKINESERIGWVCLEFDIKSGVISITDGDISDNNELTIQKKTIN